MVEITQARQSGKQARMDRLLDEKGRGKTVAIAQPDGTIRVMKDVTPNLSPPPATQDPADGR